MLRLIVGISVLAGCHHLVPGAPLTTDGSTPANDVSQADAAVDAPVGAPVAIQVTGTMMGAPIDARFAGLSYEKGMLFRTFFDVSNARAVALFERLGQSSIRIGGGSCDSIRWNPSGAGHTTGEVAPPDVDRLAAFLATTGWTAIYCVDLETGSPALAADEVAYVTAALGDHLAGIEIGNEPDNYGWSTSQYLTAWQAEARAVVQATPHVVLTGPALGSLLHDATWVPAVTGATPQVSLFTQHFYISCAGKPQATMDTMLSPAGIPFSGLDALRGMLAIPYRMAETNSYCGGGQAGVSDTFGAALWAIDYLFAIAKHGGTGANLHTRSPNYSSVLLDSNGTITSVQPLYDGLLFFSLAGTGRALRTTQDAGGLDVTAYALARADGSTAVIVVNQTSAHPISFTVDLGRAVTSATQLTMTAPSLDATAGVTIQGASVGLDGSFTPGPPTPLAASGTLVRGYLDAHSAALVLAP